MRPLFLLLLTALLLPAQNDLLKEKFDRSIRNIAEKADAVVGYAVKDLRTGETFLFNEKELFPTASSIKIFILAEVYRQAANGTFSLKDVKPVPSSAAVAGSGVLSLLDGKSVSMSIRDYCVLMMNLSDNTATNLLIDLVGMKNVNAFAAELGCGSTKLQRRMMDVQAAVEGRENVSSPRDFLTVLEKLHRGEVVSASASSDMLSIMRLEKDGWIKSGVPSGIPVANKGGDVEGVKCDAGIVDAGNAPYILCVMTKMLRRESDGGPIITKISSKTFHYLERKAHSNEYGRRIPH